MSLPPTPDPHPGRVAIPVRRSAQNPHPHPNPNLVEILSVAQCWHALTSTDLGRLAIRSADDIDVFPVNFLAKDRRLYFRTAPGAKLIELTAAPRVAFEADGIRDTLRWSVVINGTASRLTFDSEIQDSGILSLRSAEGSPKWNYVRITPHKISGRRFLEQSSNGAQ